MAYQRTRTVPLPYSEAVAAVREALAEQGFGILSEIDVRATLKAKRGTDIEDYIILGACNPALAERALDVDRSIGALLPCTVVVRASDEGGSVVQMLDPQLLASLTDLPQMQPIADEAATRLAAALDALP